jgi:sortase A
VPQTAQIGEVGNAVIAGHRNYTFGTMFNRLDELELGDAVKFLARNGEEMLFEVFEIAVIEPHDQIAFIQPVNNSIITLYTCTPVRTATHRLIIRAQRIF